LHFAGPVIYTVEGWVNKNRDELHQHITELLSEASSSGLSTGSKSSNPEISKNKSSEDMKYDTNCLMSELFPPIHDGNIEAEKHNKATVGGKFLQQLAGLRNVLTAGDARFVRCIKTNNNHLPRSVDRLSVLNQLVCGGVMAALEVRRAGYPNRIPYAEFVNEYRILLSTK
jgi:myosin heavy subunit